MTGRDAVMGAFDRLFDRAATKLQVDVSAADKTEATRSFAERFSDALSIVAQTSTPPMSEAVLRAMEEAIDRVSPAQIVGYLAAMPLARQTQDMLRTLAYRAAEQRVLEHVVGQADDTYGGN